jgi:hypothetical protein
MSSRRHFLRGAAGAALALPFLPSLSRSGHAAAPPRRFIFVFSANGQQPVNWLPQGTADWKTVDAPRHVREVSLTGQTGPISTVLGAEFSPLRGKLLLLRGLDFVRFNYAGHVPTGPLSGWARDRKNASWKTGQTVDQMLASSSQVYPSEPPLRLLNILMKPKFQSPTSVSNALVSGQLQTDVPHLTSIRAVYDKLFGSFADTGDPRADQRRALRTRTTDKLRAQYQALRAHPRLSGFDRQQLDGHISHLAAIESRLMASAPRACGKPAGRTELDLDDENNLPQATRDAIDLTVAGIKCDRTRVVTLMLCGGSDIRKSPYLAGGSPGGHHGLSHDAAHEVAPRQALARINQWYGQQVAYLLSQLDQVEDQSTGATYLDNSLVYWGNEDGCNQRDAHWTSNMPVLLAGSCGGHFRTGRYLDYRSVTGPDGMEKGDPILYPYGNGAGKLEVFRGWLYNSLLMSIRAAYGLPDDGQGMGDYDQNYQNQYSLSDGRKPLPHLT